MGVSAIALLAWPCLVLAEDKDSDKILPETVVTATRIDDGIKGTSTTVIEQDKIASSPARSLPELLSKEAGIQTRSLFGNGVGTFERVDIRGFGATATQNTLILLDGRRLNDISLGAVDFANIPKSSIERIEITRGNAGAVLYGDGAVGGVVNIITKKSQRAGLHGEAAATYGSYEHKEGFASVSFGQGNFTTSASGSWIDGDGYRDNSDYEHNNFIADARYLANEHELYFRMHYNDQEQGYPGARLVTPVSSELDDDRKGTSTPDDYGEQEGLSATAGAVFQIGDNIQLIADMGGRTNDQSAYFISAFGADFNSRVDTTLDSYSMTPRLIWDHELMGVDSNTTIGLDFYYSDYDSDRKRNPGDAAIHSYDGEQHTFALYAQSTVQSSERMQLSFGGRWQYIDYEASDQFDPTAPGASAFDAEQPAIDNDDNEWALHLGAEYAATDSVAIFGRVGRSFRLPTIDERIKPFTGDEMDLETQTSYDIEAGLSYRRGPFRLQTTAFLMELENEIHFNPDTFTNENFDDTRRMGIENSVFFQAHEDVSLQGNITYTQAEFTAGQYDGNDVPLVADWVTSLTATWRVMTDISLSATTTYVGEQRMENDENNVQPKIDGYTLVDVKISGAHGPFIWSASVNNLLDEDYYNYAVASTFSSGVFNAYPLPGRTAYFSAGVQF
jgi:iron complex outermembrane receptor protein